MRDLDFRRLAWADGAEALVITCGTLVLAILGLRYWALVLGALAGRTVSTLLLATWRPHRLAWPRQFHTIAGALNFGWQVVIARIEIGRASCRERVWDCAAGSQRESVVSREQ